VSVIHFIKKSSPDDFFPSSPVLTHSQPSKNIFFPFYQVGTLIAKYYMSEKKGVWHEQEPL